MSKPPKKTAASTAVTEKAPSEKAAPARWDLATWLGVWLSALTLVSIGYYMLGYGVSLAVETTFALPHSTMFGSPLDLIDLSSIAIMQLISSISGVLAELKTYPEIYAKSFMSLLMAIVLWLLMAGGVWLIGRTKKAGSHAAPDPKRQAITWKEHAMVIAAILASPLLMLLLMAVFVAGLALTGVLPIIGHSAGNAYIKEWVVGAERCAPVRTLEQLRKTEAPQGKKINVIPCVAVFDKDKGTDLLLAGRMVVSTPHAVVVFDPYTGHTEAFAVGDVRLRPVAELKAPSAASAPAGS